MSLLFGGASTDRVEVTGRNLQGSNVFTLAAWVYPTALTNNACVFGTPGADPLEHSQDSIISFIMRTIGSAGAFGLIVGGTGTNVASVGSTLTTNTWQFIAAVLDIPNTRAQLYKGTTAANAAEVSYSVQTVGTGTPWNQNDPSNDKTTWGARFAGGAMANSFSGRIATGMLWSRALTLAELIANQFTPVATDTNQENYIQFGYTAPTNGNQPDWSGHSPARDGTIFGATVAAHVTPNVTINPPTIPTLPPAWARRHRLSLDLGL